MNLVKWLLAKMQTDTNEIADRERARRRLIDQENRVQALDRTVEVIQRSLAEDRPHAHG